MRKVFALNMETERYQVMKVIVTLDQSSIMSTMRVSFFNFCICMQLLTQNKLNVSEEADSVNSRVQVDDQGRPRFSISRKKIKLPNNLRKRLDLNFQINGRQVTYFQVGSCKLQGNSRKCWTARDSKVNTAL